MCIIDNVNIGRDISRWNKIIIKLFYLLLLIMAENRLRRRVIRESHAVNFEMMNAWTILFRALKMKGSKIQAGELIILRW